jgi:hypothetical protein
MFFVFLLCIGHCFSRGQKIDSLLVYKSINQEFDTILSSFIEHEMQYDYFDSTCVFRIVFYSTDSATTICIMSGSSERDFMNKLETEKHRSNAFLINNHNHYWYSVLQNKTIDSTLFSFKSKYFYVTKKKKKTFSKYILVNDDTYFSTYWIYVYQNREFHERSKFARNYGRIK